MVWAYDTVEDIGETSNESNPPLTTGWGAAKGSWGTTVVVLGAKGFWNIGGCLVVVLIDVKGTEPDWAINTFKGTWLVAEAAGGTLLGFKGVINVSKGSPFALSLGSGTGLLTCFVGSSGFEGNTGICGGGLLVMIK